MEDIDINSVVLTAEAINTQRAMGETIKAQDADYCLAVNLNPKTLIPGEQFVVLEKGCRHASAQRTPTVIGKNPQNQVFSLPLRNSDN